MQGRAGLSANYVGELDDPEPRSDRWTIRTVLDRLADVGEPLAPRDVWRR